MVEVTTDSAIASSLGGVTVTVRAVSQVVVLNTMVDVDTVKALVLVARSICTLEEGCVASTIVYDSAEPPSVMVTVFEERTTEAVSLSVTVNVRSEIEKPS